MKTKFCTMLVVVALIMSLLTTAMAAGITAEYKDGVLTWKGTDLNGIYDVYVNGEYQDSIVSAYPNGQLTKDFSTCKITVKIQGADGSASTTVYNHKEETIPAKAATCTEKGLTEGKKCSVCGEILVAQKEVAALGHKAGAAVTENEKAATCTEKGSYDVVVYCSVCNAEMTRETKTTDALGHKEETIPGKAATCTETGLTEGKKCSVCGETLKAQEVIEKAAHTEEIIPAVAPTYTETGLTEGKKCSVCGEILKAQEVVEKLEPTAKPTVKPTQKPTVDPDDADDVPKTGDSNVVIYVVCGLMMMAAAYLYANRKVRSH